MRMKKEGKWQAYRGTSKRTKVVERRIYTTRDDSFLPRALFIYSYKATLTRLL